MRFGTPLALSLVLGVALAACGPTFPQVDAVRPPPLTPISRTHLAPEAADAIDKCWVTWDRIGGIGWVPRARDVPLYSRLSPMTPELVDDRPAWVIQVAGEIQAPLMPNPVRNPTCVMIGGTAWLFGGDDVLPNGQVVTAPPVPQPPGRLPPLGP